MAKKIILTICFLAEAVLVLDFATMAFTQQSGWEGAVGILDGGHHDNLFVMFWLLTVANVAIALPTLIVTLTTWRARRKKFFKACPTCRKFIAKTAEICPKCGDPQRQDSQGGGEEEPEPEPANTAGDDAG